MPIGSRTRLTTPPPRIGADGEAGCGDGVVGFLKGLGDRACGLARSRGPLGLRRREAGAVVADQSSRVPVRGSAADADTAPGADRGAEDARKLFQDVVEYLPDATFVIDLDRRIIAWNQALTAMTGRDSSEMLGRGDRAYAEAFHGDRKPMLIDLIADRRLEAEREYDYVERRGETLVAEAFVPRLCGGRGAYVWGMASPLRDRRGVVYGAIECIRDITERKQAETALRDSETKARLLADNIAELVALIGLDGRLSYASPSFKRTLGWEPDELVGLRQAELFHPEDITEAAADLGGLPADGQLVREYRVRRRDGAYVWIEAVTQLLRDAEGQPNCYLVSARDIEVRHDAEIAMRESEARFRTLFESSPNGIFLSDPETHEIVDCNRIACEMNGYSREELVGRSIILLHPEEIARTMEGGVEGRRSFVRELGVKGVVTVESQHRRKDGSLFPLETSMCLLTLGGRVLVMGIDRDITERKRAEAELRLHRDHLEELVAARTAELAVAKDRAEAADRVKSAFLAAMSHELRTPLNSIIGFTGILLRGLAGPLNDEQRKQLGMVGNSATHLLELINDVLDLSKIEAGQLKVEEEEFDLGTSITRVLMAISPLAERKQLTVTRTVGPEVGMITSDRRRVEQVLLNLLSNAVKFTTEGGISVDCAARGDRIVVSVRDTGIGIKPSDLDRLFRPFQQLDSGLARVYEGTGLGLSICKRILEVLGGEIRVESELGRGSTFSFSLPALKGRPA